MTLVRDKKLPVREQTQQTTMQEQSKDAPVASNGVDPDGWKRIKTSELLTMPKELAKLRSKQFAIWYRHSVIWRT